MMAVIVSRTLVVVLAFAVGFIPIAPAEHAHEADDHGHTHVLVHRHLTAHTAHHDDAGHEGVLDDDDGRVVSLDSVYTVPSGRHNVSGTLGADFALLVPPVIDRLHWRSHYFARPIHGPPRAPTGPRAPPAISPL
jgi:hypothetical protein